MILTQWNEDFCWHGPNILLQISKSSLLNSTAVMQVFDFNRFHKHNIIGELRLHLCSVDWNHVIEEWRDLAEPAKFEVFTHTMFF